MQSPFKEEQMTLVLQYVYAWKKHQKNKNLKVLMDVYFEFGFVVWHYELLAPFEV